jgi:hypothetical protein
MTERTSGQSDAKQQLVTVRWIQTSCNPSGWWDEPLTALSSRTHCNAMKPGEIPLAHRPTGNEATCDTSLIMSTSRSTTGERAKAVPLPAMKALGGRGYSSYSLLTSAPDGCDWLALRQGRDLPPVPIVQEAVSGHTGWRKNALASAGNGTQIARSSSP